MKAETRKAPTRAVRKKAGISKRITLKQAIADWFAARDASSLMYTDIGRMAALAEATARALSEVYGLPRRAGRLLRDVEAFIHWMALAASEAVSRADALMGQLERNERQSRK